MKIIRKISKKFNNKGMTLVEMIATFALLGLFMVAATRVISYTVFIYSNAKGAAQGMQVSNMIANKIVGQIENANPANIPTVTEGGNIDSISFTDGTGSNVVISVTPQLADGAPIGDYINIHYEEVTEGTVKYEAVDWKFDSKAYMGYQVSGLNFSNPGDDYPDNVLTMTLAIKSDRYGEYVSTYYIKCINVDKIEFN